MFIGDVTQGLDEGTVILTLLSTHHFFKKSNFSIEEILIDYQKSFL